MQTYSIPWHKAGSLCFRHLKTEKSFLVCVRWGAYLAQSEVRMGFYKWTNLRLSFLSSILYRYQRRSIITADVLKTILEKLYRASLGTFFTDAVVMVFRISSVWFLLLYQGSSQPVGCINNSRIIFSRTKLWILQIAWFAIDKNAVFKWLLRASDEDVRKSRREIFPKC